MPGWVRFHGWKTLENGIEETGVIYNAPRGVSVTGRLEIGHTNPHGIDRDRVSRLRHQRQNPRRRGKRCRLSPARSAGPRTHPAVAAAPSCASRRWRPTGPGSFREAIETKGPRIVVFEVGGLIDMGAASSRSAKANLTIAGQTAPSPGITLIRGGLNVAAHDVVIRHIRVRPGEAGAAKMSDWDVDALSTGTGARDVIVDHCSFTWAIDENLSASGGRFNGGDTPDAWRNSDLPSHHLQQQHHRRGARELHSPKGEHSKGSLIHDNVTDVFIVGNLYAHNMERNPLFKGGARGMVVNNLIYDPGPRAVHYNLIREEWGDRPAELGSIAMIGNVLRSGPSSPDDLAFFQLGGSGDVEIWLRRQHPRGPPGSSAAGIRPLHDERGTHDPS